MAQAEQQNDNVPQAAKMNRSRFDKELRALVANIDNISIDINNFFLATELNILKTASEHFRGYESNWYHLYNDNYFDISYFSQQLNQVDMSDVVNELSSNSIKYPLLCELSLALYRYRLIFINNCRLNISPEVINYISDNSDSKHEILRNYYVDWLNIPIQVTSRNANRAVNTIENSRGIISRLSDHIVEKNRKIRAEFEQERQTLIDEITIQTKKYEDIVTASFDKLEKAFGDFETKKEQERDKLLSICRWTGGLAVAVLVFGILSGNIFDTISWLASKASSKVTFTTSTHIHTIWATVFLDILLIYFFRIALNNYYTARDELLQLQMRKALCKFAPQFKAFAGDPTSTSQQTPPQASKENNSTTTSNNLDEFAKHIFSPLNSRMNPAPHPLDFLGQVTEAVKKAKG